MNQTKISSNTQIDKPIEETESVAPTDQFASVKTPDEIERSKELNDDLDLDFEEISDGELEEEACLR